MFGLLIQPKRTKIDFLFFKRPIIAFVAVCAEAKHEGQVNA